MKRRLKRTVYYVCTESGHIIKECSNLKTANELSEKLNSQKPENGYHVWKQDQ